VNGKSLIVNGDDFGASPGVNRGIREAHENGILTSTSVIVDAPWSEDAALLRSQHPQLGVGLHVVVSATSHPAAEVEIERQLSRFVELTGQPPTHLDSHHHVHRDANLVSAFRAGADRHRLPLRGDGGVNFIGSFFARWGGETHLEAVSSEALVSIIENEVQEGFNELCCHPGRADEELVSSYVRERETELEALCSPAVSAAIEQDAIRLVTFRDLDRQ
jgi:chitin disaccharide deacetylase